MSNHTARQAIAETTESDLIQRALARDPLALRSIMQKYNRRLFRIARSILRDDGEAEDVLQDSYIRAFTRLSEFRGDAALATWLSRIVINEALGRLRRRRISAVPLDAIPELTADVIAFPPSAGQENPERMLAQREILQFVERAIDGLPEAFRTVLVMRLIEGMSVEETAEILSIKPETVKTRLYRARELLREQIDRQVDPVLFDAFPFAGRRCDGVIEFVIRGLGLDV